MTSGDSNYVCRLHDDVHFHDGTLSVSLSLSLSLSLSITSYYDINIGKVVNVQVRLRDVQGC